MTTNPPPISIDAIERAARAASPGPWVGDRIDGTVKYNLVAADGSDVIAGDNHNNDYGPYGILNERDERFLLAAHPANVLELITELRKLRETSQVALNLIRHADRFNHEGDEETAQCDMDCKACRFEQAIAALESTLPTPTSEGKP